MSLNSKTGSSADITISLCTGRSKQRQITLPCECTAFELKEQISLARSMTDSNGHSIDVGRIKILQGKTVLPDTFRMKDLGDDCSLVVDICPLVESDRFLDESVEIGQAAERLREMTREDAPLAQHRHMIQEHQRQCTAAVTDAISRTRKSLRATSTICGPIWEEEDIASLQHKELITACESFISLLMSERKLTMDISSEVNEFADSLLATSAFVMMESDESANCTEEARGLSDVLTDSPIDAVQLADALLRELHSGCAKERLSPLPVIERLVSEISSGQSVDVIAETLSMLMAAYASMFTSPTAAASESLLGAPAQKATLSPEIRRWALGLRRPNP